MSFQYDIDSFKSDMKYKADQSEVKDVKIILEEKYALKSDLNEVANRLINYTKIDFAKNIEKDLENFKDYVTKKYLSEEHIVKNLENFQNEINQKFALREEVEMNFLGVQEKIPQINEDIKNLKRSEKKHEKQIGTSSNNLINIRQEMKEKCDIKEAEKLKNMLRGYASISKIEGYIKLMDDKIKEIVTIGDDNKEEMTKISSIISRFDEILNEKASKISLEEVKRNIQKFIPFSAIYNINDGNLTF